MLKKIPFVLTGLFLFAPLASHASMIDFNASDFVTLDEISSGTTQMGSYAFEVGDFDNDGKDDIAVASGDVTYVVKGGTWTSGNLSASAQYVIETSASTGNVTPEAVGDINGDGFDDLLVVSSVSGTNKVRIFYGSSSLPSGTVTANSADVTVEISSSASSWVHVGDVDSNGKDDLLLGNTRYRSGSAFIYEGRVNGYLSATLTGASSALTVSDTDFTITGERPEYGSSKFGQQVYVADIDDDGDNDLLVGAPQYNEPAFEDTGKAEAYDEGVQKGVVYVFYGDTTTYSGALTAGDDAGARILGASEASSSRHSGGYIYRHDRLGETILSGDFDNNGKTDVVLGGYLNDAFGEYAGVLYILNGNGSQLSGDVEIADEYDAKFLPSGEVSLGWRDYTDVGDLNGDGFDDIVFPGVANEADSESYLTVFYGGKNHFALEGVIGADSADAQYNFAPNATVAGSPYSNIESAGFPRILDVDGNGKNDLMAIGGDLSSKAARLFLAYSSEDVIAPHIRSGKKGKVRLRTYNGSFEFKRVFSAAMSGRVEVLPWEDYYIVLHQQGRRLAVLDQDLNVLKNRRIATKSWKYNHMQIVDLKNNGTMDIVVTSKRVKNRKVKVQTFRWNPDTAKLVVRKKFVSSAYAVKPGETDFRKARVFLRKPSRQIKKRYGVHSNGKLYAL